MSQKKPPHPAAARPPSPTRGEGCAGREARTSIKNGLVGIGARSKYVTASPSGTTQPSPLVGDVEADGGQHATSAHDADRDRWFRHQGFTVARYWNSDILDNPEGVLTDLTARAATEQEALQ